MITATKEVTFDCAHMLSGHSGLCKNLHGHTYKVLITAKRNGLEELIYNGSSKEMVIDFKDLKKAIQEEIVEKFDHAFVYDKKSRHAQIEEQAEKAIYEVLISHGLRVVDFPGRPTAENMSRYFGEVLQSNLAKQKAGCSIVSVKVFETPTSYAEWRL